MSRYRESISSSGTTYTVENKTDSTKTILELLTKGAMSPWFLVTIIIGTTNITI